MGKNTWIWIALGGGALWYLFGRKPDRAGQVEYLKAWIIANSPQEVALFVGKLGQMSDDEVNTVYDYIHDFITKNKNLVQGSDLYNKLMILSDKYQIFT